VRCALTEGPTLRRSGRIALIVGTVHPRPARRYHLVAIGGGTAGLVAALGAAGLGAKVALIERGLLGGDCLNTGCVPSKAVLHAARAVADARAAQDYGVLLGGDVRADFGAVMARMRRARACDNAPGGGSAMRVQIELAAEDAKILLEALTLYLTEFRRQVAGTENPDFRHTLQRKQDVLERLVEDLQQRAARAL
jgi:hypothetical protein